MQKLLTFFSKNISVYAKFNDQSFNDMLSNDISVLNNWALMSHYVTSDKGLHCLPLIHSL